MSLYIKNNGIWTPVTQAYTKVSGSWQTVSESDLRTHVMTETADFYKGEAPTTKYVTNLLPQFVQGNYTFDRMTVTNWTGSGGGPGGNIIRMNPSGAYSECFIYPIASLYPMLHVGHTYYIRWWSRTEGDYYGRVTYDIYWPEMENRLVKGARGTVNTNWTKYSYVLTLNQSQWPGTTVVDGNYKFRFDVNNQRDYKGPYSHADFMLIDLTADYTNQGYSIPTKSELDAKPYFYGQRDITQW